MGTPEDQSEPTQSMPPASPPSPPPQPVEGPPSSTAPPPSGPAAPAGPSALSTFLASMSRAEMFMAGGAALVVLTDLIFVILGPYAFSHIILGSAMAVLVLVLLRRRLPIGSFDWLLIGIVTIGSLMAVRELISDVVFMVRLSSPAVGILLGMVGLYVGVGLMAFGAWQLWQRRRT